MPRAGIVGSGSFLPGQALSNADVEQLVGPLPGEILAGLQTEWRHWIVNPKTGSHSISNSGMACRAAAVALESAGMAAEDVGLIVVSTASPDYHLPGVAPMVQEGLGLERCATVDLRAGCTGSVLGIDLARHYIESGYCRAALVIGSEAISPLLFPLFQGRDPESIRMRDRIPAYAFGDGAGAVVVTAIESNARDAWIGPLATACLGGRLKPGLQVVGGGTHAPIAEQLRSPRLVDLRLDVVASERVTPGVIQVALEDLLARTPTGMAEIEACILPEGNAGYLATHEVPAYARLGGLIVENLTDVGATGSAAVPIALDAALNSGRVPNGARIALVAIETSKWLYAAMTAKLSIGPHALIKGGSGGRSDDGPNKPA